MGWTRCCQVVVAASLLASWVVLGYQQTWKLKTRDSDGAALCAQEDQDEPSRYAAASARMSSAPAVVGCSMTCSADLQCGHFNYVITDSEHPCHLYYYHPTHFDEQPNCSTLLTVTTVKHFEILNPKLPSRPRYERH